MPSCDHVVGFGSICTYLPVRWLFVDEKSLVKWSKSLSPFMIFSKRTLLMAGQLLQLRILYSCKCHVDQSSFWWHYPTLIIIVCLGFVVWTWVPRLSGLCSSAHSPWAYFMVECMLVCVHVELCYVSRLWCGGYHVGLNLCLWCSAMTIPSINILYFSYYQSIQSKLDLRVWQL